MIEFWIVPAIIAIGAGFWLHSEWRRIRDGREEPVGWKDVGGAGKEGGGGFPSPGSWGGGDEYGDGGGGDFGGSGD